jgi:hypothetical protein
MAIAFDHARTADARGVATERRDNQGPIWSKSHACPHSHFALVLPDSFK